MITLTRINDVVIPTRQVHLNIHKYEYKLKITINLVETSEIYLVCK